MTPRDLEISALQCLLYDRLGLLMGTTGLLLSADNITTNWEEATSAAKRLRVLGVDVDLPETNPHPWVLSAVQWATENPGHAGRRWG